MRARHSFFALLFLFFLDNFGLAVVYPIFTPLMLEPSQGFFIGDYSLSDRTFYLGILISAFPLAQFFGAPFFGWVADCMGRKKAFYFTLLGELVGFIGSGLAISYGSYFFLVASRVWTGFFAGNLAICLAAISDYSCSTKLRAKNFALVAALMGASFIIAVFVGGVLSNRTLYSGFHPSLPFYFTALICLFNLGLILWLYRPTFNPHHGFELHVITNLIPAYAIFFFFMLGWMPTLQFMSAFLIEYFRAGKMMITLTFVCIGSAWFLTNLVLNPLIIKKIRPQNIFPMSLLGLALVLFFSITIPSYVVALIGFTLAAVFASFVWSNCLASITALVPSAKQGQVLGFNQAVSIISMIIAPLLGGVIALHGAFVIYMTAVVSIAISFLIAKIIPIPVLKEKS